MLITIVSVFKRDSRFEICYNKDRKDLSISHDPPHRCLRLSQRSLGCRREIRMIGIRGTGTPQDNDGGMGVLRFLWEPGNIERLRKGLQHVATLTPEGEQEQRTNLIYSDGVGPLKAIAQATAEKHVPIVPDVYFATGCWCDWAYLVNLDQNTLI